MMYGQNYTALLQVKSHGLSNDELFHRDLNTYLQVIIIKFSSKKKSYNYKMYSSGRIN